jgi:hypothetical protein
MKMSQMSAPGRRIGRTILLGTIAFILAGTASLAQSIEGFERNRNTSVRDRARPDYDSIGIGMAPFVLLPKLDFNTEFDSNIYANDTNSTSDFIFRIRPEARLLSRWSRHELDLLAYSQINQYADHGSENTTDFGAKLAGRLDIYHTTLLSGSLSYDHLTESRAAQNVTANTISPVEYNNLGSNLTLEQQFGLFKLTLGGQYSKFVYQNGLDSLGGTVFEKDRNLDGWDESARLDYALTPDTSLYVSGALNQRNYDLTPPAVTLNRDSTGFNILGGASFDLTNLVTGDIGFGYFQQTYDHLTGQDTSGFAVNAAVTWFPTQLTTVSFKAERRVQDAAVNFSAGYVTTGGTVQIDHELRRNIILSLVGGYSADDYSGIDRKDDRWNVGLSANYLVNRYMGLVLSGGHSSQRSSGTNRFVNYDDNKVTLTLVLQR